MGNVYCVKCGMEGESKCPRCRNVFPDNRIEAMLSHVLKFQVTPHNEDYSNGAWLSIKLYIHPEEYGLPPNEEDITRKGHEALYEILQGMAAQTDGFPTFKQWACIHQWEFKPGCKPLIDCGHK